MYGRFASTSNQKWQKIFTQVSVTIFAPEFTTSVTIENFVMLHKVWNFQISVNGIHCDSLSKNSNDTPNQWWI